MKKVLRAGRAVGLANHTALVHRDGSRRSIADSGAPIKRPDGTVAGVVLVFRDVSDERAAEIERDKLAAIVQHSSELVAMADLEGQLFYLNRAGRALIGVGVNDSLPPLKLTDYVPGEAQTFFRDTVMRTVREQGLWEGERRLQHLRTGARIEVHRSVFLVRHPQSNEPIGYATVTRDITAQKQAERALREAAERHRLALAASELGTWDWDISTGDQLWDRRCKEIIGFAPEETVTYERFLARVLPEDRARVDAAVKLALEPGTHGRYDVEFRRRGDGENLVWVRSKGQVFQSEGKPTRMIGAALDISDQRIRQEELEARVTERTRALTAANERLKELDRLKSEFLASMSHELRTPLNSIIGFTEIVLAGLAGPLTDEQSKQLQMSLNSSRHLLSLISDLLDLARIESGRATLSPERFELKAVLRMVENTLGPLARRKSLPLRVDCDCPTELFTDRKMVYQIILNLGSNAVKFTETGSVEIACEEVDSAVRISVADTGIGIKRENLGLLFEAFRQVDGSARRKFEGTGLGLHLSKRLAGMLGGDIAVESEFGKGSRFIVTLPVQTLEPAAVT